jgi:hypothetical protein
MSVALSWPIVPAGVLKVLNMCSMKRVVALAAASVLVVGVLGVDPAAAQNYNANASKATLITFSKPIRLPGVTLPAGTYEFLHPAPMESYHVVQVFSKDGTQAYGMFLTVPDNRLTATDQTVVTFKETPAGSIDTIRAWFFPGHKNGDEFLYSKEEALEIAKRTHETVLTTSGPVRVNEKGEAQPTPAK